MKVNPQAVSAVVYQIKTIAAQYQLDAQHTQALTLQALGKIAAEPQQSAAAPSAGGVKGGKPPSQMDAFADLPLPADDGPGAEPDSGNPFGSDDDDDEPAAAATAQHGGRQQPGGGGAAFGGFGQQPAAFGAPPAHSNFGAPQGHMMQQMGGMGGMGGMGMGGQMGGQMGGNGRVWRPAAIWRAGGRLRCGASGIWNGRRTARIRSAAAATATTSRLRSASAQHAATQSKPAVRPVQPLLIAVPLPPLLLPPLLLLLLQSLTAFLAIPSSPVLIVVAP